MPTCSNGWPASSSTNWATPDEKYNVATWCSSHTRRPGPNAGAVVQQVRDDGAAADFNHPLAGQPVSVRSARSSVSVMSGNFKRSASAERGRAPGFAPGGPRHRDRRARHSEFGAPIYVRHEIVHNTYVVNDLKAKGAIFHRRTGRVPPGATWCSAPTA